MKLLQNNFKVGLNLRRGLPSWLSGKKFACQQRWHRRCGFDPWIGKIPWRRKWQPIPVFLTGESHELQHTTLSCPSLSAGVCSNSCPLSQWCHPTILSSVIPFFPAPNPSQHQSLFQWVNSSHGVAKLSLHSNSSENWKDKFFSTVNNMNYSL